VWKGTAFGGFKSRKDVPNPVQQPFDGDLLIDHYITHVFDGIAKRNDAIDALHGSSCLRAVVIDVLTNINELCADYNVAAKEEIAIEERKP
jgi:Zn-dependent alcohol dehydrogenase